MFLRARSTTTTRSRSRARAPRSSIAVAVAVAVAAAFTIGTPVRAQRAPHPSTIAPISRVIPNYHPIALTRAAAIGRVQQLPGGPALLAHALTGGPSATAGQTNSASVSIGPGTWMAPANGITLMFSALNAYARADYTPQSSLMVVVGGPSSAAYFQTVISSSSVHPQMYVLSIDFALVGPDHGSPTFLATPYGPEPDAPLPPGVQATVSSCQPMGARFSCTVATPATNVDGIMVQSPSNVAVLGASLTWM